MQRGRRRRSGRWAIQRERFQIEDRAPPLAFEDATPLGDVLSRVMKKAGLSEQHWAALLEDTWDEIAGAEVARHTRPGPLHEKTLSIYVDSPVWLNELRRMGQRHLLNNLQKQFGPSKITAVRLELDPG
jgi:predicted nucleic acid-binding Zn ribbon protein